MDELKIIWSPSALNDIDLIAEYIARDSVDRAALFVERLIQTTDHLQASPFLGRIIPEIDNDKCREIIYGSYRIMYKIKLPEVWIAGVVHSARDWSPHDELRS